MSSDLLTPPAPSVETAPIPAPKIEDLIARGEDRSRPSLENRVAYQWEGRGDIIGFRHGMIRDGTILDYIASGIDLSKPSPAVLDVGCGYGNHLLMLNSQLGKPQNLRLVGVNLDPNQLAYAQNFAANVPGYQNCQFQLADLSAGLPFADQSFDAIALSDVLEHMTDPPAALRELVRLLRPNGLIILSTPLRGSLFKSAAALLNKLLGGRLYRSYYRGKNVELDAQGRPVMDVHAGHEHISEMTYRQLVDLFHSVGLEVRSVRLMQIMSGSRWFDRHPFMLSMLLWLEAVHGVLKRPSWSHSATFKLRAAGIHNRNRMISPASPSISPMPVFSLFCRRDLEMGITCLRSLAEHCKDSIRLLAVSDGSLDAENLRRFRAEVPQACFMDRAQLATHVDDQLQSFPHCQAFRKIHAWALKLIDIPLHAAALSAAGCFGYVDSDVLFVQDFRGLDRRDAGDVRIAFMQSPANIYSLDLPQRLKSWGRTPLVDRCNAGMMYVAGSAFDLNRVEAFLSMSSRHANILLAEQTAWAALAVLSPSGYFQPDQVAFPFFLDQFANEGAALPAEVVALHFVGGTRHLIPRFQTAALERRRAAGGASPAPAWLGVRRSRRLRLHGQAWDIVRHRLRLKRWRSMGLLK